jgi:hypothetical protein
VENYGNNYMPMMGMPNEYYPMPAAGMQNQYYPMASMSENELEALYPKTYSVTQPVVENVCDRMTGTHGTAFVPTREQMESMTDEVYSKVEKDIEAVVKESPREEERQFVGGGRRLLRDLIGILLIGSLIRRRRRPYPGYPGYYGGGYGAGFGGSFGGYPY